MMLSILIVLVLVGFNAFFSLGEVALISARKNRLMLQARQGSRTARMAVGLMEDTDKFLSTAQLGITVVSILTGIYTGAEMSDGFALWLQGWGLSAATASVSAKTIILVVATYLQCVLGELFPKRVGIDLADRMAKLCAPPMLFFAALAKPFVWLMSMNTKGLVYIFRLHKQDNHVTEEEIKSVIQEGSASGEIEDVEQDIMERAMVMSDQKVDQIMTYRTDIVTLRIDMTAAEVERVIIESPFANYPVTRDDINTVCGFVSLKDLVVQLRKKNFQLSACMQKPIYFPESMTVYKALEHLKKYRGNFAFVCDEFGDLQGLITLRDIFEGLVGAIQDEEDVPNIIQRHDGESWVVSGQCPFYDFVEYFSEEERYDSDYNTLAGLLLVLLDHIPAVGEQCSWQCFDFRIAQMDGNRIDKVVVTLRKAEPV